ncbi:MAG: CHAD domain-containing protein [Caldimonas sp.]
MTEVELKFSVDPLRAEAVDAALRRLGAKRVTIESIYFDTEDRRLAEAGLSLRLRRIGRAWEQTLKAPGSHAAERAEETVPRRGRWDGEGPPIQPQLHAGTPAGAELAHLSGKAGLAGDALRSVYSSVIVRRSVEVRIGDARVEVAFDRGVIRAGERAVDVCEVEYEIKAGDAQALCAVARTGVLEHGMWWNPLSKAVRGDRLLRGTDVAPATRAAPAGVVRGLSGPALVRTTLKSCLDQALANAGEIVAGHHDAEPIHQLRVGLRRLRTVSRELGAVGEFGDQAWALAVGETLRALGEYRDRQTVATSMQDRLTAAGSPQPAIAAARADAPDPVSVVHGAQFQCALLDVFSRTLEPSPAQAWAAPRGRANEVGADEALRLVAARFDALHRLVQRSAKRFERLDADRQHGVRKRVKTLRYLAEILSPLYRTRAVERYLARLRPAQDALGAHVDTLVALRMAREAAQGGDGAAWFNVGWLSAQLPASARRCRDALRQAAGARPFW